MEILILAALAFIGYKVWKSGVFHRKPPLQSIDDIINRGRLYQLLNKHMEELRVNTNSPLSSRMAHFLLFGTKLGQGAAGISTLPEKMENDPESAAIVMLVQQGIHTLMTLEKGEGSFNSMTYKNESVNILMVLVTIIFGYKNTDDIDRRGREILASGAYVTKLAAEKNEELLRYIHDSWSNLLEGVSDQTVAQMGDAMKKSVNWCQEYLKRQ